MDANSMSSSSIYSALDPSEMAQDRQAISEKLRKHQQQMRTSRQLGLGGYEDTESRTPRHQHIDEESSPFQSNAQRTVSSSLYSNLDPSVFVRDRKAINEKLRKHQLMQQQKQGSLRQGGYENEEHPTTRTQSHEKRSDSMIPEEEYTKSPMEYEDDDISESIDVLKITLGKECGGLDSLERAESKRATFSKDLKESSRRMRRHDSYRSPIIDTSAFTIPQIGVEIPTSQSMEKSLHACFYIFLCIALLISYAFFLESCKLMNYGS